MKDSDALWDPAMTSLHMRLQQHSFFSLWLQTWFVNSKCSLVGAMPKLSRSYVSSTDTWRNFNHPFFGGGLFVFLRIFFSVFINWHYQSDFKAGINSHWGANAKFSLDVYFQIIVYLKIIFWWWDICHRPLANSTMLVWWLSWPEESNIKHKKNSEAGCCLIREVVV